MHKLALLIFTLLSFEIYSQSVQDCADQAYQYGMFQNAPTINDNCKDVVLNNAYVNAIDYSKDNYIQVFGTENMIRVEFHEADINGNPVLKVSGIISGVHSQLHKIKALDIDDIKKQVYALNENREGELGVVSVQAIRDGSLAALTKLYTEEIEGATNIRTDRNNNELYVVSSNWIKVFHIDAHHRSSRPEMSIALKRRIEGYNTQLEHVKDVVVYGENLLVLSGQKVLLFPRVSVDSDVAPIQTLINNLPADVHSIDLENGSLVIKSHDSEDISLAI